MGLVALPPLRLHAQHQHLAINHHPRQVAKQNPVAFDGLGLFRVGVSPVDQRTEAVELLGVVVGAVVVRFVGRLHLCSVDALPALDIATTN